MNADRKMLLSTKIVVTMLDKTCTLFSDSNVFLYQNFYFSPMLNYINFIVFFLNITI